MPKEIKTRVKEVIQRTHNVKSARLEVSDADFKAGQFMVVMLHGNPELKRCLSISNSPTEKGYMEFTKKLTESTFSKELDNLQPGDPVKVQYPMGNFTLEDAKDKIAFLSGGIGITPIRSICKYAVDNKLDTAITLLYGNQSLKDIVFKDDFAEMARQYSGLKVVHVLHEPDRGFDSRTGLINKDIIKEEVPDYKDRKFYICGPPAMVAAMKKIITEELALPAERVITENFQGY
ncbi:MAG: xylene monooxygenase [Candidatus Omnitrophica bacterium]|nr:xylene monooxygenase [Candidatus Omnitrophota bacterium]MBU4488838.1 xylene monooxygenase [Candidatus Omnitrophota bacterium]MCG2705201.1 FAD-binding oxidoreductase [Candidatus Omnitrophota bacterium]